MENYSRQAWVRLGRTVYRARRSIPSYQRTEDWADAVGRSSRVVLGLERGEKVGKDTLMRVEELLGWDADETFRILEGRSLQVQAVEPIDGEEVRAYREAHHLKHSDIATAAGVGQETVQRWESGYPIPEPRQEQLRKFFAGETGSASPIRSVADSELLAELLRRAREREGRGIGGGGAQRHDPGHVASF